MITSVLAILQPLTLPISGNETILDSLIRIIVSYVNISLPECLRELGLTTAVDTNNHREMIFQKVVIPSSPFLNFLISNRNSLTGLLFHSFMNLLSILLRIGPFHLPTLEFVFASQLVITISNHLTSIEAEFLRSKAIRDISYSLDEWQAQCTEVRQSGKRMIQALILEGLEDALEENIKNDKGGAFGLSVVLNTFSIFKVLGGNANWL
ncbi:hypothetical protein BLNAU_14125 [Blattamonas nauphoetae]|uniref:Uncharacterized protein n=1 Tax=Blattamonas nauphoetae TaxID=2049346 RepID=A0ABQ9XLB2_9EUKA|nr:hypothetical protein BLNAU_14125 [Blattamonas nauphoetae]